MDSSEPVVVTERRPRRSVARWLLIAVGVCVAAAITVFVCLALALVAGRKGALDQALVQHIVLTRTKMRIDIVSICQAIDNYTILNSGEAPATLDVLLTRDGQGQTYLHNRTELPLDPWGNAYGYEPPTYSADYRVFSLGKDGLPGGSGDDADIDNVTIDASSRR